MKLNYEKVFYTLIKETEEYLKSNDLKAMILGISGGIDSTVVAAICNEVSVRTGIPLIGRSLPIKNKSNEFDVSELVGKAFCTNFRVCKMKDIYERFKAEINYFENPNLQTSIADGNIQARLRMIYLYNLASVYNGIVLSTDNQTEYQLGFWTIHGDVGDFDPIQELWKTEVYELAKWILEYYIEMTENCDIQGLFDEKQVYIDQANALYESIKLTPTDGLGISNSDLEQIGAKSYIDVDDILQQLLLPKSFIMNVMLCKELKSKYGEVVEKIWNRHCKSEFKRKKAPIFIERKLYM